MCGIAGHYSFGHGKTTADDKVIAGLKHRGPDNQAHKNFGSCTLFHTRLSIIDLSAESDQPFVRDNKIIIFNGEIFNYKELSKGLELQTSGDVEVLFRLFEKEKTVCLDKLNGFFAFSFYDE